MNNYAAEIDRELAQAEDSRAKGLEGRARVCARRAAALAARAWLEQRGEPVPSANAIDLFQALSTHPALPSDALQTLRLLLMRVTPEYTLPVEADLIAEARRLASLLLSR